MPAELRDSEYMHNVMYKFLTLPTEPEREALLPVPQVITAIVSTALVSIAIVSLAGARGPAAGR